MGDIADMEWGRWEDEDREEFVEIDVVTIGETELAIKFYDGNGRFWVPKSVMDEWPPEINDSGVASIKRWFAEKEGRI